LSKKPWANKAYYYCGNSHGRSRDLIGQKMSDKIFGMIKILKIETITLDTYEKK